MSFLAPFPGSPLVSATLLDHQGTGNVAGASHTFSMNCGSGGSVVLCAQLLTNSAFSICTIGGVTATLRASVATGSVTLCGILTATGVPSGTQNVTLSVTGSSSRWGAQLYSIKGNSSIVPNSTATDNAHTTGSPTATINVGAGGLVIGSGEEATGTATTSTWSGITTDVNDNAGAGNATLYTSGSKSFPSGNASLSTSVTFSGGTIFRAIAAWALWNP